VLEVGKRVQVFNCIFVSVEFTTLSGFNASGHAAKSQVLLACNFKVFRMVHLICLSRQLSEVNIFRHENSGQQNGVFSGIVDDKRGVEYTLWKGTKVGAGPEQPRV